MSETLSPSGHNAYKAPKSDIRETLGLPSGFVTEKGSAYKYTSEGKPERWKYDGTHHEPLGLTVFVEGTDENLDTLTRLGAQQSHLPPEMQKKAYVAELDENRSGRKVFDIYDVEDPEALFFVLVRPTDGQIIDGFPVSIHPKLGDNVFEIGKTEDGKTIRHPGHRVSKIVQ
jgi:hypothetical protein